MALVAGAYKHVCFATSQFFDHSGGKTISIHATFAYSVADFGLVLTELCINDKENSSLKQLAAVLLRQYVDTHWSELSEKFTPPETPTHVSLSSLYYD